MSGQVAEVLAAHVLRDVDPACSCGWDWDASECILPSAVDFDPARYRMSDTVRPRQHRAHVAEALASLIAERERAAAERYRQAFLKANEACTVRELALARVEALADEWATEGPSQVRHAYDGRDVHEGLALERCAGDLRAALSAAQDDVGTGSRRAADGPGESNTGGDK